MSFRVKGGARSLMMRAMRRWLLILMVLLLPLRGLVGDAMAGQMLEHGMTHAAMAATTHAAAGSHDAHGHGHDCDQPPAATADAEPQPQANADCPTCASCQVCSSVALSPTVPPALVPGFAHARPHSAPPAYASAEPSLAFKPPRA